MEKKILNLIELSVEDFTEIISNCVAAEMQKRSVFETVTSIKTGEDELLTREETKNLLKTSYTSLWKYNKEGILKAKKLGNKVYYLKQDVINQLNEVV